MNLALCFKSILILSSHERLGLQNGRKEEGSEGEDTIQY
jgi:hypothetical protein